ncbi:MAG: ISAs1 family transposase [Bacteroidetes bacterium]|nr:MAG: ISAs1 family transposase [Bacteroidota bacterium]
MEEPRRTNKGRFFYPLEEILFLSISAVVSGSDSWTSICTFGQIKLDWLRKFYPYKNGIPSHDVLGKLFARLDHKEFAKCFSSWVNSLSELTEGEVVAVDGKTIRRSGDGALGKSPLHVVSAYASGNRVCLGQETVSEKSNEITAIPELLKVLDIKGCTITIDAMGCQKKIAKQIMDNKANYILMVKDNQKELKEQVEHIFTITAGTSDTQYDVGHGRTEIRVCKVINDLRFLDVSEEWHGLKSLVKVESERCDKKTGKTSHQDRYYISSLDVDAEYINNAVRQHWAIENNLHWSLDVIFKEDESLKKKGNSALNYGMMAKMALILIEKEKTPKMSKPSKRYQAALDDNFRAKILNC